MANTSAPIWNIVSGTAQNKAWIPHMYIILIGTLLAGVLMLFLMSVAVFYFVTMRHNFDQKQTDDTVNDENNMTKPNEHSSPRKSPRTKRKDRIAMKIMEMKEYLHKISTSPSFLSRSQTQEEINEKDGGKEVDKTKNKSKNDISQNSSKSGKNKSSEVKIQTDYEAVQIDENLSSGRVSSLESGEIVMNEDGVIGLREEEEEDEKEHSFEYSSESRSTETFEREEAAFRNESRDDMIDEDVKELEEASQIMPEVEIPVLQRSLTQSSIERASFKSFQNDDSIPMVVEDIEYSNEPPSNMATGHDVSNPKIKDSKDNSFESSVTIKTIDGSPKQNSLKPIPPENRKDDDNVSIKSVNSQGGDSSKNKKEKKEKTFIPVFKEREKIIKQNKLVPPSIDTKIPKTISNSNIIKTLAEPPRPRPKSHHFSDNRKIPIPIDSRKATTPKSTRRKIPEHVREIRQHNERRRRVSHSSASDTTMDSQYDNKHSQNENSSPRTTNNKRRSNIPTPIRDIRTGRTRQLSSHNQISEDSLNVSKSRSVIQSSFHDTADESDQSRAYFGQSDASFYDRDSHVTAMNVHWNERAKMKQDKEKRRRATLSDDGHSEFEIDLNELP